MRLPALAVALLAVSASAQVTRTTAQVTEGGSTFSVDVYRPQGAGPFPLVAIGHGFMLEKSGYEGLARALGAEGIAAVVPQFSGSDHARNGRVLLAAVDQQVSAGGIDATKVGLAGHSAGGLSAFLAAAQRSVSAVVLLDAVDANDLGSAAAANVSAPTLFLFGEPSFCNSQTNSTGWFAPKPGLKARAKVVNAAHCDPMEPISATCTSPLGFPVCGGNAAANTARSAVFKRYAVAFSARFLKGAVTPCLETQAQSDQTAGTLASADFQLGGCGGTGAGGGTGSSGGGAGSSGGGTGSSGGGAGSSGGGAGSSGGGAGSSGGGVGSTGGGVGSTGGGVGSTGGGGGSTGGGVGSTGGGTGSTGGGTGSMGGGTGSSGGGTGSMGGGTGSMGGGTGSTGGGTGPMGGGTGSTGGGTGSTGGGSGGGDDGSGTRGASAGCTSTGASALLLGVLLLARSRRSRRAGR